MYVATSYLGGLEAHFELLRARQLRHNIVVQEVVGILGVCNVLEVDKGKAKGPNARGEYSSIDKLSKLLEHRADILHCRACSDVAHPDTGAWHMGSLPVARAQAPVQAIVAATPEYKK